MKLFFLTFFIVGMSHFSSHAQSNYRILSVPEFMERLAAESRDAFDMDTCLSTNSCYVYYLKSGEVAVLPNGLPDSSKGLLFSEKKYFLECVENDFFPIENENQKIEERNNSDIKEVDQCVGEYISKLASYVIPKENIDPNNVVFLSRLLMIVKKERKKMPEKYLIYSALAVGEYIRKLHNGKWMLLKRYGTFNPYYVPAILYSDDHVLPFWDKLDLFFMMPWTPEEFSNYEPIKNPSLIFEGNFLRFVESNYYGYKILSHE